MKRLLVVLLAILYGASGMGLTLREHYCMGERTGAEIGHSMPAGNHHRCPRCGMQKKANDANGCCKDKVRILKASAEQIAAKAVPVPMRAIAAAVLPAPVYYSLKAAPAAGFQRLYAGPHGPPFLAGPPVYLRVRCLRL